MKFKGVLIIFFAIIALFSFSHPNSRPTMLQVNTITPDFYYKNCLCQQSDTILNNGNFVKYKMTEAGCVVSIKLNGEISVLPINYKCPITNLDVPTFYDADANTIYLIKGSGFNSREIIVCEFIQDSIVFNAYSTNRFEEANMDIFIFKKQTDKSKIFMKGLFNLQQNEGFLTASGRKSKYIALPEELWFEEIDFTDVELNLIRINFKTGKSFEINYKISNELIEFH